MFNRKEYSKQYNTRYYKDNQERLIKKQKEWNLIAGNKEKRKEWNQKNLEKGRIYAVRSRVRNGVKQKQWRQDNKTKLNDYYRKLYLTNINYRISKILRIRLWSVLKNQTAIKCDKTINLSGCPIDELKKHIETQFRPGMAWDNHGEWHIDHIKPCSKFDLLLEKEQRECFHYTNLQPLWASDNLSKNDKYFKSTKD